MIIFLSILNNEEKEFIAELYNKLYLSMFKIAMTTLKNKNLSEEAVSNTFIKIMENIDKISKLSCPEIPPYCVNILKNESINIIRKDKKHLYTDDLLPYMEINLENKIEEDLIRKSQHEELHENTKSLSEEERLFLIYRYVHKLSYKEIGSLLKIQVDTAAKRNQRILEKIRKNYKGGGKNE